MAASRLYLPTFEGDIVQIGVGRAIVLTLTTAQTHLNFVESMADGANDLAAVYPDYWRQARDDLRWAIAEAEARLAAALARQAVRA